MQKLFEIPGDICTNSKKEEIINLAEKAIEEGGVVGFLGMKINSIDLLHSTIDDYCTVSNPNVLMKYLKRIMEKILYRQR